MKVENKQTEWNSNPLSRIPAASTDHDGTHIFCIGYLERIRSGTEKGF